MKLSSYWFELKDLDKLNYISVYELLGDMAMNGYTSLDIYNLIKSAYDRDKLSKDKPTNQDQR